MLTGRRQVGDVVQPSVSGADANRIHELTAQLCRLERRETWLLGAAVAIILLLTAGVTSFSVPGLSSLMDSGDVINLQLQTRGLIGLVLLFSVYALYQRTVISRLRRGVIEQQLLAEQFRQLAMFDPLTGLYNRRFGEERLNTEMARSRRRGHTLTVLLLDLDGFKQINDSYGHVVGDTVLREFGEHLRKATRGSDLVVRYGGDEFLVLLPECELGHVQLALKRLKPLEITSNGHKIPVTFSAGWTDYQPDDAPEQLLARADQALYLDKGTSARMNWIPAAAPVR